MRRQSAMVCTSLSLENLMLNRMVFGIAMLALVAQGSTAQAVIAAQSKEQSATSASTNPLDSRITLDLRQVSLKTALQAIADQGMLKMTYGGMVDRSNHLVTV